MEKRLFVHFTSQNLLWSGIVQSSRASILPPLDPSLLQLSWIKGIQLFDSGVLDSFMVTTSPVQVTLESLVFVFKLHQINPSRVYRSYRPRPKRIFYSQSGHHHLRANWNRRAGWTVDFKRIRKALSERRPSQRQLSHPQKSDLIVNVSDSLTMKTFKQLDLNWYH